MTKVKDKNLYKEVSDIFDGYHPLALYKAGVLYINESTIQDKTNMDLKKQKLEALVKEGPACWELKAVELGDYPKPGPLQYGGVNN